MVDADEPRNGRVCDRCPLFTLRHMVPDFIAEDPQQRYRGLGLPVRSCSPSRFSGCNIIDSDRRDRLSQDVQFEVELMH